MSVILIYYNEGYNTCLYIKLKKCAHYITLYIYIYIQYNVFIKIEVCATVGQSQYDCAEEHNPYH